MLERITAVAALLATAGLAACAIGAPPGFSSGDAWSIPLVGPMEDGALVVPVFVNDAGPYLMLIDPDSSASVVDDGIVSELKLRSGFGPRLVDESDTTRVIRLADIRSLRLGTLTIDSPRVQVGKIGAFTADQRLIRGVIGRDVVADSLAFGFDRDRGMAYLATQKGFTPPVGTPAIGYDLISSRMGVLARRILDGSVGGHGFHLHLDLGATQSQLRASLWSKAGLATVPTNVTLTDEIGTQRTVAQAGVGSNFKLGPIALPQLKILPFDDRRWDAADIDGTVGLDAFRGYRVWVNADKSDLYVTPRPTGDLLKERLARWNSAIFAGCAHLGCVEVTSDLPAVAAGPALVAIAASGTISAAPGAPMRMLPPNPTYTVTRDASAAQVNLEVLLEAVDASSDARVALPRYSINLPVGYDKTTFSPMVLDGVDPASVRWIVRDASPFPRTCRGGVACAVALPEPS